MIPCQSSAAGSTAQHNTGSRVPSDDPTVILRSITSTPDNQRLNSKGTCPSKSNNHRARLLFSAFHCTFHSNQNPNHVAYESWLLPLPPLSLSITTPSVVSLHISHQIHQHTPSPIHIQLCPPLHHHRNNPRHHRKHSVFSLHCRSSSNGFSDYDGHDTSRTDPLPGPTL